MPVAQQVDFNNLVGLVLVAGVAAMAVRMVGKESDELEYQSIHPEDLKRISDKYGWWAARRAESVCPHNNVACVEREAKRLIEVYRYRRES